MDTLNNKMALRKALVQYFDLEEIKTLCFDMGVDYDDFPGDTKSSKARSLITYCERRSLLDELQKSCQASRPSFSWETIFKPYSESQNRSEKLTNLRNVISKHFSTNDLKDLCFKLNIDPELLPASTKESQIRELVLLTYRNDSLSSLLNYCQQERPQIDWSNYHSISDLWNSQSSDVQSEIRSLTVTLTIDEDFENFSEERKQSLQKILASLLDLDESEVQIVGLAPGSVKITLEMPDDAAQELLTLLAGGNPVFTKLDITKMEIPQGQHRRGFKVKRPIKILFLGANPTDSTRLRLDEEIRSIDESLRQADFRDLFVIEQHWAVRISDLQSCLLRHKPDIVHFSGHGTHDSQIILEDKDGNGQAIPSDALSKLFGVLKKNVKCVILNACYSEQQATAIAEHIPCVIGMNDAIGDEAAIEFSSAFYQAVGYGEDINTAHQLGCVQIGLYGLNDDCIPALIASNCNPSEVFLAEL